MEQTYIWLASHHTLDDESQPLITSTSLLTVQDYVIKKCEKVCKEQNKRFGNFQIEYLRVRRGNKITFTIQSRTLGEVFEWYSIKRVRSI